MTKVLSGLWTLVFLILAVWNAILAFHGYWTNAFAALFALWIFVLRLTKKDT